MCFRHWFSIKFEQQHAVLKYYNEKYIKDVKVLTGRNRRNGPYRTNCTVTVLVPFGNNITTSISYKVSGVDFTYKFKFCEIIKRKWMYDYVKSISDLFDNGGCPFQPRTYSIYNMEFPPKNCPLPLPQADTTLIYRYLITSTEEVIFELQIDIKIK
ncbi:hypothetical protein K1T71_009080 [Dendrolimus kikuchii]|uniref:Uncharacterized protein n=1 Tax=Dendrolimus kikuchii TaxID=765133 RepID=A0ACC1CU43_9NEOP|nr:hypothetical protein K1T71_009080 [Dendrolimus kikuchii]